MTDDDTDADPDLAATDHAGETEGEDEPDLDALRRRRKIAVVAALSVVAAGALGIGLWKGPAAAMERAKEIHIACSNANYDVRPGASLACEGAYRPWLRIALTFPWTSDEASEKELEWGADEIETRLTLATEVMLDRDMQATAADELATWMAQPGFPADRRTTDWAFSTIAATGNRELTIEHVAIAGDSYGHAGALDAAFGLAEIGEATRIANIAKDGDYDTPLRRGAWLCLVDDVDAGRAALQVAAANYRESIHHPYLQASIAALACGAQAARVESSDDEAFWAAQIFFTPSPGRSFSWLQPQMRAADQADKLRSIFFADWLGAEEERAPVDVVAAATGLGGGAVTPALTPWGFRGPTTGLFGDVPVLIDPERHESAARKVDALLAEIEARTVRVAPRPVDRYDFLAQEWEARAKDGPAKLREASALLWLETAGLRTQMFDREGFARALQSMRDEDLQGPIALLLASYAFRLGDRAKSRQLLQRALAMPGGRWRIDAELSLAMLELADRRPGEALAAARRAAALVPEATQELGAHPMAGALGNEVTDSMRRSIGWVEAAAALAAGETSVENRVAVPEYHDASELPQDWFALARADDHVRRKARFRMFDPWAATGEEAVLPAVIYVLQEVARDGTDPDVYVDRMLPLSQGHGGITVARARAEAARIRGDAVAVALWDGRADTLQALVKTPRDALLAGIVGIE